MSDPRYRDPRYRDDQIIDRGNNTTMWGIGAVVAAIIVAGTLFLWTSGDTQVARLDTPGAAMNAPAPSGPEAPVEIAPPVRIAPRP
jgi:hypothetical protein